MKKPLSSLGFVLAVCITLLFAAPAMANDLSPPTLGQAANLFLIFGPSSDCTAPCADFTVVHNEETTCGVIYVDLTSGSSRSSPAYTLAESGAILVVEMVFYFDDTMPTVSPPGWEACTCLNEPINGVEATGRSGPHEGVLTCDCFGASAGHSIVSVGNTRGSPTIDQGARDLCQDIIWNREPAAEPRNDMRVDCAFISESGQITGTSFCGTTADNSHPDGFDLRRTNAPPARNLPMRC